MFKRTLIIGLFMFIILSDGFTSNQINRTSILLDIPAPQDSAGGIIVADVNNDDAMDFLVTVPGHLAVYDNSGEKLWIKRRILVWPVKARAKDYPVIMDPVLPREISMVMAKQKSSISPNMIPPSILLTGKQVKKNILYLPLFPTERNVGKWP